MHHRVLGRTGWKLSEVGYGAWQIGGNMWGGVPEERAAEAIRAGLESGIDFYDTALAYGLGRSEQLVGRVLREENAVGRVRVATKVPPKNRAWPASPAVPLREAFPREWIRSCAEESLRNLDIPVDLLQLHVWTDAWADDDEWFDELSRLKDEGKIRAFGVSISEYDAPSALKLTRSGRVDTIQLVYNVFEQAPNDELLPAALEGNVGVIVRVPLDEGALAGKLTLESRFAAADFRSHFFAPEKLPAFVRRAEAVRPLLEQGGQSMATGALRFCLSHPAVSTVIVGSTSAQHVRQNAAVSELGPLPEATLEALRPHAWDRRPR